MKVIHFFCLIMLQVPLYAQFSKIFDFEGRGIGTPVGTVSDGTYLYGITHQNSTDNIIIFRIKSDGSDFYVFKNFKSGNSHNDYTPSLLLVGDYLYGVDNEDVPFVFKIRTDDTEFKILKRSDEIGTCFHISTDGTYLFGSPEDGEMWKMNLDGSNFYKFNIGLSTMETNNMTHTISDGSYIYGAFSPPIQWDNDGVLFKVKYDGSGFQKLKIFNFMGVNGSHPTNIVWDAEFIYGSTYGGGQFDAGVLYKIKSDGSQFKKLYDFKSDEKGASLFLKDGEYLLGGTYFGGKNQMGSLFEIKKDGTDLKVLVTFGAETECSIPINFSEKDNYIYGTTLDGDEWGNDGSLFKYKYKPTSGAIETSNSKILFVHPNPFTQKFEIKLTQLNKVCNVSITDIEGRLVYKDMESSQESIFVDGETWRKGIYIVKILTNDGWIVYKIIKQ
jgi:uncharacterized repeat protein (TIGR03803 family)